MEGAKDADDDRSAITVQVKFSGRTLPVSLPMDATVADLKSLLQPLTNVLTRGQTLICKGTSSGPLSGVSCSLSHRRSCFLFCAIQAGSQFSVGKWTKDNRCRLAAGSSQLICSFQIISDKVVIIFSTAEANL
ncbi:hypothetical protein GW17_00043380 [Ensete ventricosum]|nr:hypothetical protein GW17_00043380 [Ensete ventricosum]